MKGFKVIEIFRVDHEDDLLELHINLENYKNKKSLSLELNSDAETIRANQNDNWVTLESIQYEIFSTTKVGNDNDLSRLIGCDINHIQYGIGRTLFSHEQVLYYFRMDGDFVNFIFFNNGDTGCYLFNNIDDILANDNFGEVSWSLNPPN